MCRLLIVATILPLEYTTTFIYSTHIRTQTQALVPLQRQSQRRQLSSALDFIVSAH